MAGYSIADIANGLLILVTGLLAYFGIRGGKRAEDQRQTQPGYTEVAGALVDNRAVDKLSGEVAGQSLAITAQVEATKKQTEAICDQTRAIIALREEVHDMSELSRAITDLATQVARRH